MVDLAERRPRTRSRFHRLVGVRDLEGGAISHAPAIFTEDQWGEWKAVLHRELRNQLGAQMIVWTPHGESVCEIEDKANGQTLLVGLGPPPF